MKKIFNNTNNFFYQTDSIYSYIYYKKNKYNFNYETEEYRNNFLFNFNHSRYFNKNIKYDFDPLIFEENNKIWPDYVTHIYYTKLTYMNKLVQLSYSSNLFINLCLNYQPYAPLVRIGFYAIYDILSEYFSYINYNKQSKIIYDDIFKKFLNKKHIMIDYENTDFFFHNYIMNNFNYKKEQLISSNKNNILTTWAYKNFFDYIPACYVLHDYNPINMIMSNICYHNNHCHDSLCKTHNNIISDKSHLHYDFQSLYKFNESQIINIYNLN